MVVNTLRAVRWTFSTSGLMLIYLASAGGVLAALLFGWGFVDGARWGVLVSLLVARQLCLVVEAVVGGCVAVVCEITPVAGLADVVGPLEVERGGGCGDR